MLFEPLNSKITIITIIKKAHTDKHVDVDLLQVVNMLHVPWLFQHICCNHDITILLPKAELRKMRSFMKKVEIFLWKIANNR